MSSTLPDLTSQYQAFLDWLNQQSGMTPDQLSNLTNMIPAMELYGQYATDQSTQAQNQYQLQQAQLGYQTAQLNNQGAQDQLDYQEQYYIPYLAGDSQNKLAISDNGVTTSNNDVLQSNNDVLRSKDSTLASGYQLDQAQLAAQLQKYQDAVQMGFIQPSRTYNKQTGY